MALHCDNNTNLLNYSDPFYSFSQHQQQQFQCFDDEDQNEFFFLSPETELLCFEPTIPPALFPIVEHDYDPIFFNPPISDHNLHHSDHHHHHHHGLIQPDSDPPPYPDLEFPPPLLLPPDENFPCFTDLSPEFHQIHENQTFSITNFSGYEPESANFAQNKNPQFDHILEEQSIPVPCFTGFSPELELAQFTECGFLNGDSRKTNETKSDENGENQKPISAQSRAARERRRKITEKTQQLGKLVPGRTKMNTAEMLQAAFKYVKFLQSQLQILQFVDKFQQETEQSMNCNSLHILASQAIQEKLYKQGKCLVPMEFVPKKMMEHCDLDDHGLSE